MRFNVNVRVLLSLIAFAFLLFSSNFQPAADPPSSWAENAANETKQESIGFPERLHQAYHYGRLRQFNKSTPAFEELLRTNPDEFIVYDFYAQTLDAKRDYPEAILVYEKWLPHSKGNGPDLDEVAEKISRLRKKEAFKALMAGAPPWEDAKVYGTIEFTVKSNIPKEYQNEILSQVREIISKERKLLEGIFGYPLENEPSMKVFIAGCLKDYEKLLHEFRPSEERVYTQGSYLSEARNMIVFFDGDTDLTLLAHEMAHHLILRYIKSPSMLLNEGLAEYLSYQVAKEAAKVRLLDHIQLIHWLHEQGEWESTKDIFRIWQDYLGLKSRQVFLDLKQINQLDEASRIFYMGTWTLIYFFIEGGDEFYNNFFRNYLAYERNNQVNDFNTTTHFFDSNLTHKQIKDFDNKWTQFVLNLTYDRI